jgi:hypothetical protein
MFYAKGVNCCAEVMFILGDLAVGLESTTCGDLPLAFADKPVPPYFPDGMSEYVCHAFPDDERPVDSFIVALIALASAWRCDVWLRAHLLLTHALPCSRAVSLPVTLFLQACFEIANDNEAPESWLCWSGLPRLLVGLNAHRRWHYTLDQQPSRFVRWFCRSVDAPKPETLANLGHSLVAWLTGSKPPWTLEAEAAAEAAEAEAAQEELADGAADGDAKASEDALSAHGLSVSSAVQLRRAKRQLTAMGFVGVYVVWAVFSWFIFVRAAAARACYSLDRS